MKNILLNSLLLVALIPLITLAIEPSNPQGFCERFIAESDIKTCQERTKKEEVDWYAATVCNLQKDDQAFWSCWDSIKGQAFNPAQLEHCGEGKDLNDGERQTCVNAAISNRSPAAKSDSKKNSYFQSMKASK